jgi:hypothetical protein
MKVGEAYMKPYSRGNKKFATQGKRTRVVDGDIHKDGVDHPMFEDHKISSLKKKFSHIQEEGKQNGKDSNSFVMVTNDIKKKPRKDRPMPIWAPMKQHADYFDTTPK